MFYVLLQPIQGLGDALQGLGQLLPGAGEVQPLEAVPLAVGAELGPVVRGHPGLMAHKVPQLRLVHAIVPKVQPGQIGSLRRTILHPGHSLGDKFPNVLGVAPEIDQQLLQPVLPLVIGGDLGRRPKVARPQVIRGQLLLKGDRKSVV